MCSWMLWCFNAVTEIRIIKLHVLHSWFVPSLRNGVSCVWNTIGNILNVYNLKTINGKLFASDKYQNWKCQPVFTVYPHTPRDKWTSVYRGYLFLGLLRHQTMTMQIFNTPLTTCQLHSERLCWLITDLLHFHKHKSHKWTTICIYLFI